MIKSIILDLDGTLIDTTALESLRSAGRWRDIPGLFNQCMVYQEVLDVLNTARAAGIKVAIFTNSPSNYANRLLNYFEIAVDLLVAYHDVQQHKPSSDGVFKVLEHFGISCDEAVYIGDTDLDRGAAENANVKFFAVNWGNVSNVDVSCFGALELSELIGNQLGRYGHG